MKKKSPPFLPRAKFDQDAPTTPEIPKGKVFVVAAREGSRRGVSPCFIYTQEKPFPIRFSWRFVSGGPTSIRGRGRSVSQPRPRLNLEEMDGVLLVRGDAERIGGSLFPFPRPYLFLPPSLEVISKY